MIASRSRARDAILRGTVSVGGVLATKPGQERVLAIRMTRAGFDLALASASLSHFEADVHGSHESWLRAKQDSPVRVQWDPERDAHHPRAHQC